MEPKKKLVKTSKNSQSQTNIFLSNHAFLTVNSEKKNQNIDHKYNNVLTPANKNISSQEQPKRPRILSKVRNNSTFAEEFKLGKVLGKGRFGNVQLALHNLTGSIYAAKQISL